MDTGEHLIKQVNIQKIAEEGAKIYEKIKAQYDPQKKGKFLAIDIDTEHAYLGDTSAEALERAREQHPSKIFYVVKIGYETAETMAKSFVHSR